MLVNGMILKGDVCPYREECNLKYSACNGHGCPFVEENKTHTVDFSCGAARFFALVHKHDEDNDGKS